MTYLPRLTNYYYDKRWFNTKWQMLDYASTERHPFKVDKMRCVLRKDFSFDRADWKKEPAGLWEDLCVERMLKIRDTYPKICLMYSGGSDSQYILELCLRHNIKIDELVSSYVNLPNFPNEYFNWDMDNYAIPFAKEFASHIPHKLMGADDWGIFQKKVSMTFDGLYKNLSKITPSPADTGYHKIMTHYIDRGFVLIDGSTEPNIYYDYDKDKYFADMWDTDNFLTRAELPNLIPFFTDPACPEIHIKQCHLVLNYMRKHKIKECLYKKNYDKFKDIFCALTRDNIRIGKNSPHYSKKLKHPIFPGKKEMMLFQFLSKGDEKASGRWLYFLNNSINNKKLWEQPKGIRIGKWYLE